MRTWPPYSSQGSWPDEDDPLPDDSSGDDFDQLLVVHGLAVGPYTPIAAVQAELRQLGELREAYRQARWVTTASRIVAAVFVVAWMWTSGLVLLLPAIGFTLLAVHRSHRADVYPERGRELDADIADARERLRGMLQDGEENT